MSCISETKLWESQNILYLVILLFLLISDVRYGKFYILPITIIALFFYRDTIIITIYKLHEVVVKFLVIEYFSLQVML